MMLRESNIECKNMSAFQNNLPGLWIDTLRGLVDSFIHGNSVATLRQDADHNFCNLGVGEYRVITACGEKVHVTWSVRNITAGH